MPVGSLLVSASPLQSAAGRGKTRKNGVTAKKMKKVLKAAGLKTTGKKAALTKRVKKAGLLKKLKGGMYPETA